MSSVKMIGRAEAVKYMEETLHVQGVEERLMTDKVELLSEVMRAVQSEIPYHNIWMLTNPHVPSEEEAINAGLLRTGGLCVHMNYFTSELLKAVGYDTYLAAANYGTSPFPEAHMICIVRGLGGDDHKHLVDVGSGYPMFDAVPLHDLPKVYQHSALTVKYTKSDVDGHYYRWHTKRDSVICKDEFQEITEGHWIQIFSFIDKERDFNFFKKTTDPVFNSFHPQNRLQQSTFLTRFPGRKNAGICMLGMKLLETDDNGYLAIKILSINDMIPNIKKHFPEVHENDAKIALKRVSRHLKNDRTNSLCGLVRIGLQYVWYSIKQCFNS